MALPTDEELMEQFCAGQSSAFEALYSRRAPAVQAYLTRLVRDRALAEDLLQATFLSVVQSRDRWHKESRVAPWIFSIATNAVRDTLRRRGRWRESEAPLDALPAPASQGRDPALARRLEEALAQLPLQQREAVVLHHLWEWSFEEMAEALGTSAVTLRVRCHRGFAALRRLLGEAEVAP